MRPAVRRRRRDSVVRSPHAARAPPRRDGARTRGRGVADGGLGRRRPRAGDAAVERVGARRRTDLHHRGAARDRDLERRSGAGDRGPRPGRRGRRACRRRSRVRRRSRTARKWWSSSTGARRASSRSSGSRWGSSAWREGPGAPSATGGSSPARDAALGDGRSRRSTSCGRACSRERAVESPGLRAPALCAAGARVRADAQQRRRLHLVERARAQLPGRRAGDSGRVRGRGGRRGPPQLRHLERGLLLGSGISGGADLHLCSGSPGGLLSLGDEPQSRAVPDQGLPGRRPERDHVHRRRRLQQSLRLLGPGRRRHRQHDHHLERAGPGRSSTATSS